jgi:murein DD-endopeptidase MepM/ murein hydrolase activator NlpD
MFRARRMVRRGIRRGFRRLTRATVLSMAMVAGGVTLAAIAAREGVSREEAEEMMDGLVEEGVVKKETKNGETVYVAAGKPSAPAPTQPAEPSPQPAGSTKFCRSCGTKIPLESKFCEKCGAQL